MPKQYSVELVINRKGKKLKWMKGEISPLIFQLRTSDEQL